MVRSIISFENGRPLCVRCGNIGAPFIMLVAGKTAAICGECHKIVEESEDRRFEQMKKPSPVSIIPIINPVVRDNMKYTYEIEAQIYQERLREKMVDKIKNIDTAHPTIPPSSTLLDRPMRLPMPECAATPPAVPAFPTPLRAPRLPGAPRLDAAAVEEHLGKSLKIIVQIAEGTFKAEERAWTALSSILFEARHALWKLQESKNDLAEIEAKIQAAKEATK